METVTDSSTIVESFEIAIEKSDAAKSIKIITFPAKNYEPDHKRSLFAKGIRGRHRKRVTHASATIPTTAVRLNGANSIDGTDGSVVGFLVTAGAASGTPVRSLGNTSNVEHSNTTHTFGSGETVAATVVPAGVSTGPSRHNVHFV